MSEIYTPQLRREYLDAGMGPVAALMMDMIDAAPKDEDGWAAIPAHAFEEAIGISPRSVPTVRRKLAERGILQTNLCGKQPVVRYKIHRGAVAVAR